MARRAMVKLRDREKWRSVLGVDKGPGVAQIKVIVGAPVDDGVGEGVVVKTRRWMAHAELRLMDVPGQRGIDGPIEAKDSRCVVRLKALGFRRRGERERLF